MTAVAAIEVLPADDALLEQCEQDIRGGCRKAAMALKIIRDRRLYLKTHPTLEAYCADKFGFTRIRAYQLIGFAEVSAQLPDAPLNEAQARALSAVPVEERASLYEAVAAEGDVTAEKIQKAARLMLGRPEPVNNSFTSPEASLTKRLEAIEIEFLDMVYADGAVHDIAEFEHTLRHLFLEVEARLIRVRPQHIETLRPLMAGLERRAA